MKVEDFLEPFTDSSVFELNGKLHSTHEIIDAYADFEVVKADMSSNLKHLKLVIDESICDCYEVTKERRYLTEYERGYYYGRSGNELTYIDKEVSKCLGTREKEECSCGGYKSQCNFYREEFMKELENDKDN